MAAALERLSRRDAALDGLAVGLSLLAHGLLVWFVLQLVLGHDAPHQPVAVTLVRLAPPPPIVPPKPPAPQPVPRPHPVVRPLPQPIPVTKVPHRAAPLPLVARVPHPAAQRRAPVRRQTERATPARPPVMHFGSAGADDALGLDLGLPSGAGGSGHGAIDAFDESVKHRIQAMKTYPPGLPYLPMECIVEYRVTVDSEGNMVDYRITGCGNPFLDSATRAAILKAAPFPRPPNLGGTRYVVFGTLTYLRGDGER